jgi:predicted branched-subunit amino acid permease
MNPLLAAAIFLAYALIDAAYALYTASVIKQKAFAAGLYSVVIYLLIGSGVVAFSSSAWYVLPAAVGGFAGTYLTVKWQARSAED